MLTWKDGRKYDGAWKNGKQDGFGFYTDEKGVQRGKWVEGKVQHWFNERGERIPTSTSADNSAVLGPQKQ